MSEEITGAPTGAQITKQDPRMITAGVSEIVEQFDNFLEIPATELAYRGNEVKTKYDVYRSITRFDPEASSGITRIAAVVAKAYDKPTMKENGNRKLLDSITKVMGEMQFDNILPSIVSQLSLQGDCVQVPVNVWGSKKKTLSDLSGGMEPLPLNITTIRDTPKDQIADANYVIRKRKTYLLNETMIEGVDDRMGFSSFYSGSIVWHMSLGARGNWEVDNLGRNTYGVWGTSPFESLKSMIRWKYQSIRDDIRWRHANVPRTDHALELGSVLNLNEYNGDMAERVRESQNVAESVIGYYKSGLVNSREDAPDTAMDTDQGYIHDNMTKVTQVGGNNTYANCLEIVKKVDMSIATRLGIPLSALGYESNSSYAIGKVTVTFMNTFGLQLLAAIQDGTFDFIRKVLESRGETYSVHEWNDMYLNYNVTDFAELKELIDAWSTAFKHGMVIRDESRAGIGQPPMKDAKLGKAFYPLFDMQGSGGSGGVSNLPKDKKADDGGDPGLYASEPELPIWEKVQRMEDWVNAQN